jgi:hypothetical protein
MVLNDMLKVCWSFGWMDHSVKDLLREFVGSASVNMAIT